MKGNRVLAVRARTDTPQPLVARLKELARSLEPGAPAIRVRNMSQIVADSIAAERFSALLVTALSALALALASIGVYAVAAFSVSRRTREFGVRLALGARESEIMRLSLREGARLVGAAVVLGTGGGWALTRFLASQLYEVEADNPLFFVASAICLAAFATVACYLPARRASRANPIAALRCE